MSELQVYNCEQGSPEWFQARLGIPTASEFKKVIASGRGPRDGETKESKGRREYMMKLIGERITGEPKVDYSNKHMERGKEMEQEARDWYELITGAKLTRVGFMRRFDAGASPDSIAVRNGSNGVIEIKCHVPHIQCELLLNQRLEPEHKAQVQGQLWISGLEWCDYISYWTGMPFIVRVERDETYIKEVLIPQVANFNREMQLMEAKIRGLL